MTRKPSPQTRRVKAGNAAAATAAASGRRRATPVEQLVTELLSVKKALDGAVAEFGARVSGQLAEVLRAIAAAEPPAKRTVKDMIVKVQDVKLKPEKGRVKDLARLQRLADDLVGMLSER